MTRDGMLRSSWFHVLIRLPGVPHVRRHRQLGSAQMATTGIQSLTLLSFYGTLARLT